MYIYISISIDNKCMLGRHWHPADRRHWCTMGLDPLLVLISSSAWGIAYIYKLYNIYVGVHS